MSSPISTPSLDKIKPSQEFIENVETLSGVAEPAQLAILHDEALMIAEGEEKMTGESLHPNRGRCAPFCRLTLRCFPFPLSFHLPPRLRRRPLWSSVWL